VARASSAASSSSVEPGERGQGVIFKDEVKGGNIPKEYIPSVEKGIREIAASGSLIGFPIIDFTATLVRRRLP
jgi:elongation factor G